MAGWLKSDAGHEGHNDVTQSELDALRGDLMAKAPPEVREAMARALESDPPPNAIV